MRVLLDEGIDEMLGDALTGHQSVTAADAGLSGLPGSDLRAKILASDPAWDAWVTFRREGDSDTSPLPGMLNIWLDSEPLTFDELTGYMPQVAIALERLEPGGTALVGKDWIRLEA